MAHGSQASAGLGATPAGALETHSNQIFKTHQQVLLQGQVCVHCLEGRDLKVLLKVPNTRLKLCPASLNTPEWDTISHVGWGGFDDHNFQEN
jgi:hypothetical protein